MTKSLQPGFNRARRHKPFFTISVQDVANLFALQASLYSTKHDYYPSVFTPLKKNFWNIRGHTLAYFTNLREKVVLEGDQNDPDNARTYPASPGVLYSEHYKFYNKKAFGLVIQPRITKRSELQTALPVFAVYGLFDFKANTFQLHKLILPEYKGGDQVGIKTLEGDDISQEVAERALLFGCLCADEMMRTRDLKARNNWEKAQTLDLKQNPPPWRRAPLPNAPKPA